MCQLHGRFELQQGDFHLNVDVQIPGIGITAIFGKSGSGKTTLLRCIAGLERAPNGFLTVNNHCWQDNSFFLPTHKRPLGYVFQEASLFSHLSVQKNLEYGYRRTPSSLQQVTFDEVIELLGLAAFLRRYPKNLSGGERQRVAIARTLLTSPQLLLMDEPLAALDSYSKADILPYFDKLHKELSIPILYVSHAIEEVVRLADHLLIIEKGQIIADGVLSDMVNQLDLPYYLNKKGSC